MKKFAQTFLLLAVFGLACEAQTYVPFPYKIDKRVVEDSAMVVTAHPLATKAGVSVLRNGGNAIDAAVAVQFALAVVYPQAGNIGGGGFLVYRTKKGAVDALDYRETAPAAAFEKMYQDSITGQVLAAKSRFGALAAGVPGTVDGMWEAHQKYGKLAWPELLQPAVELAEKGFQITQQEADNLNAEKGNFFKNSRVAPAFVKMHAWQPGDWLIQKELASTLRRISDGGRDGFYTGLTALFIETDMKDRGGIITKDDLKNYRSVWRAPLEFDHADLHFIGMPAPSSGGILLAQLLKMVENQPGLDSGFHSAPAIHAMAEAERRAYADRAQHLGDPAFWDVPTKGLLDPDYLRERMSNFDPKKATPSKDISAGQPKKESEQTTHFSIVDAQGNAVAVTTTLNDSYGSRCVVAGAGFILNNEMDDFSAKPGAANLYGAIGGKANAIAPGKRPLSSMTPTIITRGGRLWMVVGTPGGTTIPTSVFQVVMNVWKFKMPLQEAVNAGRFHHQWLPDRILCEMEALPEDTMNRLRAMGHQVDTREAIGRVEAILIGSDRKLEGVADKRGDDCAGGF